jgi:hypothetical protein
MWLDGRNRVLALRNLDNREASGSMARGSHSLSPPNLKQSCVLIEETFYDSLPASLQRQSLAVRLLPKQLNQIPFNNANYRLRFANFEG